MKSLLSGFKFEYKLGIIVFMCLVSAYVILLNCECPSLLLIDYLLGFNISVTAFVTLTLTIVVLLLGTLLQSYDMGRPQMYEG